MQPAHTHTHTQHTNGCHVVTNILLWPATFHAHTYHLAQQRSRCIQLKKHPVCLYLDTESIHSDRTKRERMWLCPLYVASHTYKEVPMCSIECPAYSWYAYTTHTSYNTIYSIHLTHIIYPIHPTTLHTCQTPTKFTHFIYFIHHSPIHPIHCISQTHGIIMTTTDLLVTIYDKSWLAMGQ